MWELDCEEGWAAKNWCFWTVVLEKTLESPLDCKEMQPVHSEADQPWDFFGRNDANAEAPVLWPPHVKSWLIGKVFDAGRDLGAGEEGDDRGWDGWMASLSRWTWVWVNSGSWWWTGRPGMLRFMGLQRVGHDWATELNWNESIWAMNPWNLSLRFRPKSLFSAAWPQEESCFVCFKPDFERWEMWWWGLHLAEQMPWAEVFRTCNRVVESNAKWLLVG